MLVQWQLVRQSTGASGAHTDVLWFAIVGYGKFATVSAGKNGRFFRLGPGPGGRWTLSESNAAFPFRNGRRFWAELRGLAVCLSRALAQS